MSSPISFNYYSRSYDVLELKLILMFLEQHWGAHEWFNVLVASKKKEKRTEKVTLVFSFCFCLERKLSHTGSSVFQMHVWAERFITQLKRKIISGPQLINKPLPSHRLARQQTLCFSFHHKNTGQTHWMNSHGKREFMKTHRTCAGWLTVHRTLHVKLHGNRF